VGVGLGHKRVGAAAKVGAAQAALKRRAEQAKRGRKKAWKARPPFAECTKRGRPNKREEVRGCGTNRRESGRWR